MNSGLNRRIAKVEAAVTPPTDRNCTVLFEPDAETANPDDLQAHQQRIDAAIARGSKPIIVAFVKADPRPDA